MKLYLMLAIMAVSKLAYSAPFCVQTSYGKNCYYYDANSCKSAAKSSDGMCVPNDEDKVRSHNSKSNAPFCVKSSYGENCLYYSRSQCESVARSSNGMCLPNNN